MVKIIQHLFVLIIVFIIDSKSENKHFNPYCHVSKCARNEHTFCKFPVPGTVKACGEVVSNGLNQNEIYRIHWLHNHYRSLIYSGKELRGKLGPLPPSTHESNLEWDNTLAEMAQRWAEQCKLGHDRCRNLESYTVGQNVAFETIKNSEQSIFKVDLIAGKWYNELNECKRENILKFNSEVAQSGHFDRFTQMLWQNTTSLGCGAVRYRVQGTGIFFLVCNYAPSGNHNGEAVYETYKIKKYVS